MKHIQITEDLFIMLIRYHLCNDEEFHNGIIVELEKKMDAIVNRNLYTQYQTAPNKEEREKARLEYLDRKGVHKDFRG